METKKSAIEQVRKFNGPTLWREFYDTDKLDLDFLEGKRDILLDIWERVGLKWIYAGPHEFNIHDRIILFRFDGYGDNEVEAVEVIEIGPRNTILEGDLSHFVAVISVEGLTVRPLTLPSLLALRSDGLIGNLADLRERKKISPEEWGRSVEILNLRKKEAAKVEKQTGSM